MKIKKTRILMILLIAVGASSICFGQQYKGWWFFAPKAMAERKVIPMAEISACLLGEDSPPGVRDIFKKTIDGGVSTQPGLVYRKMCDVGLILNLSPEEDRNLAADYPGYAIYKISGSNLELYLNPADIKYIAVAHMKFTSAQTLNKNDLAACGTTALQRLFAPSNRIWRESWSSWQAPIKDLKAEDNPIAYEGRDIWIMGEEDYKIYVKRVGSKHPTFDISPDKNELTRRK
ncbi:MAG: hypothetical protein IPG22_02515 [Acidobacteria bacterium]|nr:hypothetical protein [Acidobacteriota bacterium]